MVSTLGLWYLWRTFLSGFWEENRQTAAEVHVCPMTPFIPQALAI